MKKYAHTGVDWAARQGGWVRRLLRGLERVSLAAEKPLGRALGQWPQFNPLYHTGPITVFFLLIILITGVYLTLFYQFGYEQSYRAVAGIESNLLGRSIRALHRYASGAAVIAGLLHGWRTFFQDRFRGPRSLAWLTGVLMAAGVWLIGVSGYWLVFDVRAQPIQQSFIALISDSQWGQRFLVEQVIAPAGGSAWVFVLLVITLHLGLSALVGWFLWLHLKRLSRPKWLPPTFWMPLLGGLLLLAALLLPAGMLPPMDPAALPPAFGLDGFYLFYLPPALSADAGWWWGGLLALCALLCALPWLLGRLSRPDPAPVTLLLERCIGCTLCAADCPYRALVMVPRRDGGKPKFQAELLPELCVSCGICIGACPTEALLFAGSPLNPQPEAGQPSWKTAVQQAAAQGAPATVIFTCERHAFQGALRAEAPANTVIAPVVCIGMLHPDLVGAAQRLGAGAVQFIGCPPEDCANREGNLWMQQRLERQRMPKLRLADAALSPSMTWQAPDDFQQAVHHPGAQPQASAYPLNWPTLRQNWRALIPALVVLTVALAGQLALTYLPYQPTAPGQAQVEVLLRHQPGAAIEGLAASPALDSGAAQPADEQASVLAIEVDGEVLWQRSGLPSGSGRERKLRWFAQAPLPAGEHTLRVTLTEQAGAAPLVLFAGPLMLSAGQVQRLVFEDALSGGDPEAGASLYRDSVPGVTVSCQICHSLRPEVNLVGPSFAGLGQTAATRIPGMSAEDYLRQSMLEPDAYIVPGYPSGQMLQNLDETLSPQQIEDLIAFLLTLK